MIETKHLTKKFGDFVAVDDLNLSIEKGELFSLLGLNGAGKTTTIKMLSCLILPTSGTATILNKEDVYKRQNAYPLTQLETAISGGTGLYSFDPHLFDFPSAFCEHVGSHPGFSSSEIRFNTTHYITCLLYTSQFHRQI